eukprot:CAMPEP_0168847222 /NCGR_PEP_ID=MMETSP0727-20121128/10208_1 /TAXON_ID=265536 /ORGANISM="Amphiprora sp., Strain CCMP467" /LENGTH=333 /DNA_ID=CAMNT_0008901023 /DNA_START=43 /DNA_END=1045 /DNA_ORIENTATION=-
MADNTPPLPWWDWSFLQVAVTVRHFLTEMNERPQIHYPIPPLQQPNASTNALRQQGRRIHGSPPEVRNKIPDGVSPASPTEPSFHTPQQSPSSSSNGNLPEDDAEFWPNENVVYHPSPTREDPNGYKRSPSSHGFWPLQQTIEWRYKKVFNCQNPNCPLRHKNSTVKSTMDEDVRILASTRGGKYSSMRQTAVHHLQPIFEGQPVPPLEDQIKKVMNINQLFCKATDKVDGKQTVGVSEHCMGSLEIGEAVIDKFPHILALLTPQNNGFSRNFTVDAVPKEFELQGRKFELRSGVLSKGGDHFVAVIWWGDRWVYHDGLGHARFVNTQRMRHI